MAHESRHSLLSHDEPQGLCPAAQTSPGNPLALRMNIPASAAPMPSTPSSPQQPFMSHNTPRKVTKRNSSWQVRPSGLCWHLEQVPVTHLSFQLFVKAPCAALHRAVTFFSFFTHYKSPLLTSHSSRDCLDLPNNFFLLILSSSMNKVTLHPNPLYYSKSRANCHWKTEGQGN